MPSNAQLASLLNEKVVRPLAGPAAGTTGSVFFVSSVTGNDTTMDGTTPATPKATIDAAYNLCTTGVGDVIYVMEGHAEDLANATTLVMDKNGVTIIGLGQGTLRPELSFTHANGNVPITGNDNVMKNIYFNSDTSSITTGMTITGTNTLIENCEFKEDTTDAHVIEWIRVGAADQDAANSTIRSCKFYAPNVDHENDILLFVDQVGLTIEGCWCQGNYNVSTVVGAIGSDSTVHMTNVLVKDNVILSAASDQAIAINLDGTTNTGMLVGNYAAAPDENWTPYIAAGCAFCENYQSGALASSGFIYPPIDS